MNKILKDIGLNTVKVVLKAGSMLCTGIVVIIEFASDHLEGGK